jgi:cytochrome c556
MPFEGKTLRVWATAIALGVTAVGAATHAADNIQVVKDRQAHMKAQGNDNKAINDYAKGRVPKAAAQKAIADLQARNAKTLSLFADKATSSTAMPGVSNAKAAIWTDNAKFAAIVAQLKVQADKQAALIESGTPAQVGAAQAEMGKTSCSACHDVFREPMDG